MADTALPIATLSSGVERLFPTLTPVQIKRIAAHGRSRSINAGEVLVEAGAHIVPFFVVMAGRVEGVRLSGNAEALVAVHGPGQLPGGVHMLSGRPPPGLPWGRESGGVMRVHRGALLILV